MTIGTELILASSLVTHRRLALPGLYSTDTLLLRIAGDLALESDGFCAIARHSSAAGRQRVPVEHVFDALASRGLLKVSKTTGRNSHVFLVSPQLGRMLAEST
jgi:hypothetical protein